jgi:hypothetical protein
MVVIIADLVFSRNNKFCLLSCGFDFLPLSFNFSFYPRTGLSGLFPLVMFPARWLKSSCTSGSVKI